jgi:hypothetical protein
VLRYSNLGWGSCCLIFFVDFGHLENRGIVSRATAAFFVVFSNLPFTSTPFYITYCEILTNLKYNTTQKQGKYYTSLLFQLQFSFFIRLSVGGVYSIIP